MLAFQSQLIPVCEPELLRFFLDKPKLGFWMAAVHRQILSSCGSSTNCFSSCTFSCYTFSCSACFCVLLLLLITVLSFFHLFFLLLFILLMFFTCSSFTSSSSLSFIFYCCSNDFYFCFVAVVVDISFSFSCF